MDLEKIIETCVTWLSQNGIKLIIGLIVLFIAFKLANFISKKVGKHLSKKNENTQVVNFTTKMVKVSLKVLFFLLFLGYVGIDTAGVGTIIASLGVGLGLALQGSLANLAGGIVILIMRPFKLGDFIESQGFSGVVEEIKIFYTYIKTPDNKIAMIPNGTLANGNIVNYSKEELRRVDLDFDVDYSTDLKLAKSLIEEIITSHELVLKDKDIFIRLGEMRESSLLIKARMWTKNSNYWTVYFDVLEEVKDAFDKNGISIPFNQLDVFIKNK